MIRLFLVGAGLSACTTGVQFEADNVLERDGTLVRAARFYSSGDRKYEELSSQYELPAGGEWSEIEDEGTQPVDENAPAQRQFDRVYTAVRRFAPGQTIAPDYIRYNGDRTSAARNEIAVDVHDYWLVTTYAYRETFRDIVTRASFSAAVSDLFDRYVDAIARRIADVSASGVTTEEAAIRLRQRFGPNFDDALARVARECFVDRTERASCDTRLALDPVVEAALSLVDDNEQLAQVLAADFAPPPSMTTEQWSELIVSDVIKPAISALEDMLDDDSALNDALFGVHGFLLFESYPFELSAKLPGYVSSSNADEYRDGALHWSFESEVFVHSGYTLYARTRWLHMNRVLFVITALVVAAAILGASTPAPGRRPR